MHKRMRESLRVSSSMYNFERSTEDDPTPLCIIQLADNTLGLHKTCLERLDMVCELVQVCV